MLQRVFTSCPCNMTTGVCQPKVNKRQPSGWCTNLQVFCFLVEGSMHWETDPLHIVEPEKKNSGKTGQSNQHMSQVGHQARAYPSFCSMKGLGVLLLPPGWDASPSQGYI